MRREKKKEEEINLWRLLETEERWTGGVSQAARARECEAVLALWKTGTLYLALGFMMIVF